MHREAYDFVARYRTNARLKILEIGARHVDGDCCDCRDLFPFSIFTGIDIRSGPGVDIVRDAAEFYPVIPDYNIVLCTETLEHTENWRSIVTTMYRALKRSGVVIITAAGPHRKPHSAIDGKELRENEWYRPVYPTELKSTLVANGFTHILVEERLGDVYAGAMK